MSSDQSYPFPQVFLVDGGGGGGHQNHSGQPPALVPCWSFPPAQDRTRVSRGKSRGCMGVSPWLAFIVLMLFLLVFAALGFEAYQIDHMQKELRGVRQVEPVTEYKAAEKQIGLYDPALDGRARGKRPAAHLMGRIEKVPSETLRWEPSGVQAFTSGGVTYRFEDGALQVNESGLYHIYTRVELTFKDCSPRSWFLHKVFVRRVGRPLPVPLMEAHRSGFCSQTPGLPWTTESYLGSTLQLNKHDRVYVNVSHPAHLRHDAYANFFGVYQI